MNSQGHTWLQGKLRSSKRGLHRLGWRTAGVTRAPQVPPASRQSSRLGSCHSGFYSWTSSCSDTHPLVIPAQSYAGDSKHFYLQPRLSSSSRARAQSWDSSQTAPLPDPHSHPLTQAAMVPLKASLPSQPTPCGFSQPTPTPNTPPHPPANCRHSGPVLSPLLFSPFHLSLTPQPPTSIPTDTQAAPTSVPLPLPLL